MRIIGEQTSPLADDVQQDLAAGNEVFAVPTL